MIRKIALVGNPNVGKSTIFNLLTGLNQKVGNYPGVTVDKKYGSFKLDQQTVDVVDLPGTYSLHPKTEDEQVVRNYLTGETTPDVVVVIADAINLHRNLLLFSQVYDLKIPVILVLNRIDLSQKDKENISTEKLSSLLGGVPVIPLNARQGNVDALKSAIASFKANDNWQPFYQSNNGVDYLKETEARHQKIHKLMKFLNKGDKKTDTFSSKLDKLLLHKVWGYAIFLAILFVIFQFIYVFANVPMDLIDNFFISSSSFLSEKLPVGPLSSLVTEGIIPGVGGVVIFIPQIAFLFLFLTVLEETGYMTRVVFLMDKIMRPFGLHGKSVVPLISGVACAIPAIMSSRSIDQPKERLITILVTPLMSCSARLPVYILLIALTVPDKLVAGFINMQGLVLFGMYMLGIIAALVFAIIFKAILLTKSKSFLIMEMPRYQLPKFRNVVYNVYEKSKAFVWGAGRIILAISIILWVLGSYGPDSFTSTKETEEILPQTTLETSFIGILGKQIEPAIKPLGYDWKIGISLITSFAAREVFVGTMATIYSIDESDSEASLLERMNQEINPDTGERVYGLATGISLMIFYAFAMQCMSTLAVTKRETKSWKWPLVQLGYMTVLAYVSSLIAYQILV
ncbi:ferrous iron transport protein B [Ekhidna sp.]|uniref:ferrous iron transport protein B n=1 Tax=Ekhidna sp. TaxID=2608089 RepID=UPI003B59D3C3